MRANFCSPDSDSYGGSYFQKGGRATNHFGGLDVAPGGCHCSVLWLGGGGWRPTLGVDAVPLLGAIVRGHCSVLWLGGRVTTNWSGNGAIAGCHCSVPLQCAVVVCYGGGRGVVCYGWGGG